jgi:hypothetical protein
VRLRGIEVGHAVDVIVDSANVRALGFDVLCRDESRRFLPFTAATIESDHIAIASALTLLAEDQLHFYRSRAGSLRALSPELGGVSVSPDGSIVRDAA